MIHLALIDDDPNFGYVVELLVKRLSVDVSLTVYQRGRDFLERYPEDDPDLLLLDINMPDMNGWTVLDKLAEYEKTPQIYMLSSSIDRRDQDRALDHVLVKDYIAKPLSLEILEELMSAKVEN